MKKILRGSSRYGKKVVKIFLKICDVVVKEIFTFKKTLTGISLVLLIALLFFFGKDIISSTLAKTVVVSEGEILRRVALHTTMPQGKPTSIVRVKDAETLRVQHMFYKDIKEGDYIIIYSDRVIIYNLRSDIIVGEKYSR